jgi:hypothetical protein
MLNMSKYLVVKLFYSIFVTKLTPSQWNNVETQQLILKDIDG